MRRDHGLESRSRAEAHARSEIYQQPDRPFAFLPVALDMCLAGTGGDTPVHIARVVARHIEAGFIEIHAAAAEPGQMPAAARGQYLAARCDVQTQRLLAQADQLGQRNRDARLLACCADRCRCMSVHVTFNCSLYCPGTRCRNCSHVSAVVGGPGAGPSGGAVFRRAWIIAIRRAMAESQHAFRHCPV